MVEDDYLARTLGPLARFLAGVLVAAGAFVVFTAVRELDLSGASLPPLSWRILLLPIALWATVLLARGALAAHSPWPAGLPSEPATDAQLDRLRWLGAEIPGYLGRHQARRMIAGIESRLPATPAQQLALARYGSPRGVFTRASADRFLKERAAEELFCRQLDWAADWYEAGVEIRAPEELDPDHMEAFDRAYGALAARGLACPLPAYIWSWKLADQVDRLQVAGSFFDDAAELQPALVRDRVLRRALDGTELRQLFPGYVSLLAQVGEGYMIEPGERLAGVKLLFLAALHALRPALLLDTALGWEAAAEVRREVTAEAELRAADAAIEWDE